jgi:hypothetical protein
MSRFSDDYDEEFNNQGALWWSNAERALNGRKGLATLRELRQVLEEMPEKAIISGRLANEQGQMCVVGALVVARRVSKGEKREAVLAELARIIPEDEDCNGSDESATLGVSIGLSYMLAWRLAYMNDEDVYWKATPEERYRVIVKWIDARLAVAA